MDDREYRKEHRKQRRAEHFPPDAACIVCGESDLCCLERHHVAGVGFGDDQVVVCRNCHRKLSDKQKDHPRLLAKAPTRTECEGRKLLGIADIMELLRNPPELVELVRKTGLDLIERGQLFNHSDDGQQP